MTCYEAIDVMGEAVEGRMDPALHGGFQEHMAECRPCSNYFDQLRVTRETLLRLPAAQVEAQDRARLLKAFRSEFDPESN